ncbi:hypothetical protein AWB68_07484 [Caballeronia choica]|uniref:Uncharacterized protein n=1 Tax=Caballeronia choica TaxID=326476 RepID=A0A158KUY4_9BURK|nr:hypothetical protein [Caballeronia choica]SAL84897.1 hypothetical protein AWB68_07484 [Caballeronia choica]
MENLSFEDFYAQLGMILRDVPRGTAVYLGNFAAAYWDGHRPVFAFLDEDGRLDEQFDPADYLWEDLTPDFFEASITDLSTGRPPELLAWLKDAPPYDAGS